MMMTPSLFLLLISMLMLFPSVLGAPIPTSPSSTRIHLSSESFRPFGNSLSAAEKKRLIEEILTPEEWEVFDGLLVGSDQRPY